MNRSTGQRRILVYTHALVGGGAERVSMLLAEGLARRGHDVLLVSDHPAGPGVALPHPAIRHEIVGRGRLRGVLRLAALLRRERPDVSLSSLAFSNLLLFLAALLARCPRRVVQSLHGFYEVERSGLLGRLGFLALPVSSRLTGATVAVSDLLRDDVIRRFRAARDRTSTIHNPILAPPLATPPDEAALRARPPCVLAVGRLEPVKRFDLLMRAFAALERKDTRLAIVGDGSERERLVALAQDLGIAGRLDMPGFVPEPWPWYDRASCLVVSSESEAFGLTLVEAMARGLPVVSTDCGGPREVLQNGRLGALVPRDDPHALAQAIAAALDRPGDPAERLAYAGEFALERIVVRYEKLFETVISATRPCGSTLKQQRRPA